MNLLHCLRNWIYVYVLILICIYKHYVTHRSQSRVFLQKIDRATSRRGGGATGYVGTGRSCSTCFVDVFTSVSLNIRPFQYWSNPSHNRCEREICRTYSTIIAIFLLRHFFLSPRRYFFDYDF